MAYLKSSDDELYSTSGGEEEEDEEELMAALAGDGNGTGSEGAVGPRAKYGVDRPAIYNAEGMHDKLEDISCLDQVDWIEHQALTGAAKTEVEDVNDDVERELAFYNQALEAAKECIGRLEEAKVPWNRPRDYYAEMVKSDEHMARVKQQLMLEQKSIAEMEERRKARMQKKFAKQVQAEKQKERAQQRKRDMELIQKWRKDREEHGFTPGEEFDDATMAALEKHITPKNAGASRGGQQKKAKGWKRVEKDKKFGFGGRKAGRKENDSRSAADMTAFKPAKAGVKKGKGGKGAAGKGKKQQRPGKAKRAQMRGKG